MLILLTSASSLCLLLLSIHILLTFHLPSPCLHYLTIHYCHLSLYPYTFMQKIYQKLSPVQHPTRGGSQYNPQVRHFRLSFLLLHLTYNNNNNNEEEYTNLCLISLLPAAFYSYIPHFPSSISFLPLSHCTLIVTITHHTIGTK